MKSYAVIMKVQYDIKVDDNTVAFVTSEIEVIVRSNSAPGAIENCFNMFKENAKGLNHEIQTVKVMVPE